MMGMSDSFAGSTTTRKSGWWYACQRSVALNHRVSFWAKIEELADNFGPNWVLIVAGVRRDEALDRCSRTKEEWRAVAIVGTVANAKNEKKPRIVAMKDV